MSKFFWILVLLSVATQSEAATLESVQSEHVRCISSPKTFKIEDEDMSFSSIKILQGKKLLLESREPGANLEIDCEKKKGPDAKNNKYGFISQPKKINSSVSAVMTFATLGLSQLDENKPELELTSLSEFPVHTTIKVSSLKDELTVNDSKTGKSFRVECLYPAGSGVRVSMKGKGDKEKVAFFVGSATASTMDQAPKVKDTSTAPCTPSEYSLNIAKSSIEKNQIAVKTSGTSPSPGAK